jgi:hypothetical protein
VTQNLLPPHEQTDVTEREENKDKDIDIPTSHRVTESYTLIFETGNVSYNVVLYVINLKSRTKLIMTSYLPILT